MPSEGKTHSFFYRKIHSNFSFFCLQLILKPQNFPGLRPGPANALFVASRPLALRIVEDLINSQGFSKLGNFLGLRLINLKLKRNPASEPS